MNPGDAHSTSAARRSRASAAAAEPIGGAVTFDAARALALLRVGSGVPGATFRDGQEAAIRHVVEGRGRLLVVQRTGWGKSFVYFIATRLLREAGAGPALLVSPLLALMRNQIEAASRMGVRAATINSDNQEQWAPVEAAMNGGDVDILLISPERLANERFRAEVLARIARRIALLVVDEAHCISDWGHDFRPHYRLIERAVRAMPRDMRLLATTATANDRVTSDLVRVLGPELSIMRGDLNRPSLALQTIRLPRYAERLAWLAERLPALPGSGIVYTLTVRDAELVAAWLKSRGIAVEAYTGQAGDRRPELEQALLDNRVKALVATTALGMGFDKPDLAFVVHYQTPGSVVAYYQQVGRAGRALDAAYGVLLNGSEETDITGWFIETAFPSRSDVQQVLAALDGAPAGLSVPEVLQRVNLGRSRVQKTIDLLALESPAPIARDGTRWRRTGAPLGDEFWARAERLTQLRRAEQREMQRYAALDRGHMEFLIRALDGDPDPRAKPPAPPLPASVSPETVRAALTFLRRAWQPIDPRRQWPPGGLPRFGVAGRIDGAHVAQGGRALCDLGDGGWGALVARGREEGRFAAELVSACARLVQDWSAYPAPRWVTCVPSRRRPELVPDFAMRLAGALKLPFRSVLVRTQDGPKQQEMANGTQQALNLDGAFDVVDGRLPPGPVLLVDDLVRSRWTMAVCAWRLRARGCGEVWPLAVATAGADA